MRSIQRPLELAETLAIVAHRRLRGMVSFRCIPAILRAVALSSGVVVLAANAEAQVQSAVPNVFPYLDERGVDVTDRKFRTSSLEVVIGQPGAGGLVHSRSWIGSGWRDDLAGTISSSGSTYKVSFAGQSETFTSLGGGAFSSDQRIGSLLEYLSGTNEYRYVLRDGTVLMFNKGLADSGGVTNFWSSNEGQITSLTRPDGEVITWTYATASAGGQTGRRPQSVSNNLNFQIHFTYQIDSPASAGEVTGGFLTRTKVTGINRTYYNCADSASTCSDTGGSQNWPFVTYGTSGSVEQVTDRLGNVTGYEMSGGNLVGIRRPSSPSTNFISIGYSSGTVVGVNVGGQVWSYSFSCVAGCGLLGQTYVTSPAGVVTRYHVNLPNSRVMQIFNDTAGTRTVAFQRDSYGRITRITNADNDYTQFTLDDRGNATAIASVSKSGASTISTSASFPACTGSNAKTCNKPTSTTTAWGQTTTYQYDVNHGGLTVVTRPAPGSGPYASIQPETRLTYGDAGTGILRVIDIKSCMTSSSCPISSDEAVTGFSYDGQRRPTTVTSSVGDGSVVSPTTLTYTPQGDVATIEGPLSGTADTTSLYYDDGRRIRATVSPDPDGGGSMLRRVSRTSYDADSRPILVEFGNVSTPSSWASFTALQQQDITYDSTTALMAQQKFSASSVAYSLMQFGFDQDRRAECATIRMNSATFGSTQPSPCSLGTQGSYGPDRVFKNGYDSLSDLSGQFEAAGVSGLQRQTTSVHKPSSGLLESLTDARSFKTSYEYDDFNRLIKICYPDPSTINTSSTTDCDQIAFDQYGRISSRTTRDGNSFTYGYDNLGRVTSVDAPGSQPDVSYTYDNFGQVRQASQSGNTINYDYDALGRLKSETQQGGRTVSYLYDAAGRRTRMTWPESFPNGLYVEYDYLVTNELTAIRENGATSGPGVLATFAYDNFGRRSYMGRGSGGGVGYSYDNASRLIDLVLDIAPTGASSNDLWIDLLDYSPANQLISRAFSNNAYNFSTPPTYTDNYVPDGLNRYTTARTTITPTYDTRRNMSWDGVSSYSYDYSNRMTGAGSTTLSYDPSNRLFQMSGSSTTQFLYDGVDVIAEYDGSGNVVRRYVHGAGLDEPLVQYDGSTTGNRNHLFADERGSIVAKEGSSISINKYDEYGIPASGNDGRFQYTGQMWLSEIGLYYYKARFYNPVLGRFMQTDPIGYAGGLNAYAYVASDPLNLVDPLGLEPICTETSSTVSVVERDENGNITSIDSTTTITIGCLQEIVSWLRDRKGINWNNKKGVEPMFQIVLAGDWLDISEVPTDAVEQCGVQVNSPVDPNYWKKAQSLGNLVMIVHGHLNNAYNRPGPGDHTVPRIIGVPNVGVTTSQNFQGRTSWIVMPGKPTVVYAIESGIKDQGKVFSWLNTINSEGNSGYYQAPKNC